MLVSWHRRTTDIMKTWFCPPGMSVVRHESLSQKTKLKLTPCRWPASGIRHGLQVDKTFTSSSNLQSWPKLTAVNNTSKSQDTKLFDLGVSKNTFVVIYTYVAWGQYFRLHYVLKGLLLMSFKWMLVISQVGAMYHTYILLSSNLWGINHNYFVKKKRHNEILPPCWSHHSHEKELNFFLVTGWLASNHPRRQPTPTWDTRDGEPAQKNMPWAR